MAKNDARTDSEIIEVIFRMIGDYGNRYGKNFNFKIEGGSDDTIFVTDHNVGKTYCISVNECKTYEG